MDSIDKFEKEIDARAASLLWEQYRHEIERVIDRIKNPKSAADRWFRRQWYRAAWQRTHKPRAVPRSEARPSTRKWCV